MSTSASIAMPDSSAPALNPVRGDGTAALPSSPASTEGVPASVLTATPASAAPPVSELSAAAGATVVAPPAQVLLDALILPPPVTTNPTPAESFDNKTNPHFVVRSLPVANAEPRAAGDDFEEEFGWAIGSELEFLEEDWDGPVGDGLDEEEGRGGMAVARPIPGTT